MSVAFDEDVLVATVGLVGRTGAKDFEIGYLNDEGEPAYEQHGAQWWAKAQYRGARIMVDDHPGPIEACQALAERLLTGAKCKCGRLVALGAFGATAYAEAQMADGTTWTAKEAAAAGQCRWRRRGKHWRRDCE